MLIILACYYYCTPPEAAANMCKLSHARGLGNANNGGTGGTGISAGEVGDVSLSQEAIGFFQSLERICDMLPMEELEVIGYAQDGTSRPTRSQQAAACRSWLKQG
jgi:hypothetical protein